MPKKSRRSGLKSSWRWRTTFPEGCSTLHPFPSSTATWQRTGIVGQVADFGLSRGTASNAENDEGSDYYRSQAGVFPVRWTAPESMQTLKFTVASDVFSFAVTLIEIFQNGEKPYKHLDNAAVMQKVIGGYHHPRPDGMPAAVYEMTQECWSLDPAERPTFARCEKVLAFNVAKFSGGGGGGGGGSTMEVAGNTGAGLRKRRSLVSETNLDDAASAAPPADNEYSVFDYGENGADPADSVASYLMPVLEAGPDGYAAVGFGPGTGGTGGTVDGAGNAAAQNLYVDKDASASGAAGDGDDATNDDGTDYRTRASIANDMGYLYTACADASTSSPSAGRRSDAAGSTSTMSSETSFAIDADGGLRVASVRRDNPLAVGGGAPEFAAVLPSIGDAASADGDGYTQMRSTNSAANDLAYARMRSGGADDGGVDF